MNPFFELQLLIIAALQAMSPMLDGVMEFFSFLGTIEFYILLIPFVYWVVDASLGFRLLLLLIGTNFTTNAFKVLLHQPRPYWIGGVKELAAETSYGLPSSHASVSLAVWGYLAYRLKKDWLWALTGVLVVMIGVSRLYLAVHFPTDVLGGWLIGLVAIVIFVWGERWAVPRLKELSVGRQIGTGFSVSILMILIVWIIKLLISPIQDPPEWAQLSQQARGISGYFTLAGALFGTTAGYALMRVRVNFQTQGPWWKKAVRYLLGIAGVLVIYLGLDAVFSMLAADETIAGYVLRYIRYGTVTFWATFIAPWIFLKLKLAAPAEKANRTN